MKITERYTDKDGRKIYEWKGIINGEWDGYTYLAPTKEEAIRVIKEVYLRNEESHDIKENIAAIKNGTMKFDAELYIDTDTEISND